jgi:hypothetical protein
MLKTKLQKFDKVFYFLRFLYLPNIARKDELEIPSLVKNTKVLRILIKKKLMILLVILSKYKSLYFVFKMKTSLSTCGAYHHFS